MPSRAFLSASSQVVRAHPTLVSVNYIAVTHPSGVRSHETTTARRRVAQVTLPCTPTHSVRLTEAGRTHDYEEVRTVTQPSGTPAIVEVIKQLARERDQFTSDDIRPLLPQTANVSQIPAAVQQVRRQGIITEVGRVRSTITERKGSLVGVFVAGPNLDGRVSVAPPSTSNSHADEILALHDYLEQRGHLTNLPDLAILLLLSASRGWIVLAGPSGTGKSSIVRLLADAFRASLVDIQVKRYWTSSEEVLGYYSETAREWVEGPLYSPLLDAEDGESLQFVRFDEMNLAPPEYYAAELLSAGEAWTMKSGRAISAAIQLPPAPRDKAPKAPRLTNAILLFGTLNVDETTQPLSPKMLDRSAVITFEQVNFASLPPWQANPEPPDLKRLTATLLGRPRSLGALGGQLDPTALDELAPLLTDIDGYTSPLGYRLGYRQRDSLLIALSLWKAMDIGPIVGPDAVTDAGVYSMILPKLQGTAIGSTQYLRGLAGVLSGNEHAAEEDIETLRNALGQAKYPRSYEKVISMIEQLTTLGYFDFW
jgi:hypothetical protein